MGDDNVYSLSCYLCQGLILMTACALLCVFNGVWTEQSDYSSVTMMHSYTKHCFLTYQEELKRTYQKIHLEILQ